MNAFDKWWHEVGSAMGPLKGEDAEEHCRRVAAAACAAICGISSKEWMPMNTAPHDGTFVEILVRNINWYSAPKSERDQWQAVHKAKFIKHNGGGWTWSGMSGTILAWRPLSHE